MTTITEALRDAGRALTATEVGAACGMPAPDAADLLEIAIAAGSAEYVENLERYRLTKKGQEEARVQKDKPAPPAPARQGPSISQSVLAILKEAGHAMSAHDIKGRLPGRKPTTVTAELPKMAKRGLVVRVRAGVYALPGAEKPPAPTEQSPMLRNGASDVGGENQHGPDEPGQPRAPADPRDELFALGLARCREDLDDIVAELDCGRVPSVTAIDLARGRLDLLARLAEAGRARQQP